MSMMSELVDELRAYANQYEQPPQGIELEGTKGLLRQAADVIEEMSKKLCALQIDRSNQYRNDGWITDRMPTKEELGEYGHKEFQVTVPSNNQRALVMEFCYDTIRGKEVGRWIWRNKFSPWDVIAWKPLSEPYVSSED